MAALTERTVRQHLLRTFINYDPIVVDLTRPVMAVTAAGGTTMAGTLTILNQKFLIMPFKRRLTDEMGMNPQSYGEDKSRDIQYILIFMPDETDVKEGDLFTSVDTGFMENGDYRIEFLSKRKWDREQAVVRLRD